MADKPQESPLEIFSSVCRMVTSTALVIGGVYHIYATSWISGATAIGVGMVLSRLEVK